MLARIGPPSQKSKVEYANVTLASEAANAVIVKATAAGVRRRVTVYLSATPEAS